MRMLLVGRQITVKRIPPIVKTGAGFSLIELLIVMAIVGMAAALVIPRINSGQANLLRAQVREMVAILNYARRSAIVEGKPKVAFFYNGKQEEDGKEEIDDNSKNKPREPGHWVSRGTRLQWGGEVGDKEEAVYKITFYPEGGSSGGELILSYLDHQAKISINPLTGKVESDIFGHEEEH